MANSGTFRKGDGRKRKPKGAQNKMTVALKDMILQALDGAGGVSYLQTQATENPSAFLTLVGKVLPLQVTGDDGQPLVPATLTFVFQQQPGSENRT
jgi:hypothetical protein